MKSLNKLVLGFTGSMLAVSAFAASDMEMRLSEVEKKVNEISAKNSMDNLGPNLASARAEPKGMGWNLSIDVLYWQTKVTGTDYCYLNDGVADSPINYTTTQQFTDFDWAWGFKVGTGYNFCHDQWDTKLEYTYFRNTGTGRVGPVSFPSAVQSIYLDQAYALTQDSYIDYKELNVIAVNASEARLQVKNSYNDLYWDLGRAFFVSKWTSLRPSIGLEAAWFSFKGSSMFMGGTEMVYDFGTVGGLGSNTLYTDFHEKFVGVGPRAGLASKWCFCNGFSLFGNLNVALLYSYIQNTGTVGYSGKPLNLSKNIAKFHRLNPTAKFELGVMYDKYIMCDTQHFGISLAYENQYYWDVSYFQSTPRSVGLYGATLKVQWDF